MNGMDRPGGSRLAGATAAEAAAALLAEARLGGPDECECTDPVLWQLWTPVAYYALGECLPFAMAHVPVAGGNLCLHEVRIGKGAHWNLRHAFVGLEGCPQEGVHGMDAMADCLVLDAIGGGRLEDRGDLYEMEGEHRVVVLSEEGMLERFGPRDGSREVEDGRMIAGVASALGLPFDIREAVAHSLGREEFACSALCSGDVEALREWAAGPEGPRPR